MIINASQLRETRKKQKITQEELAQKLGVTRQTIVGYEKGEVIPETKIKLILSVLGLGTEHSTPAEISRQPKGIAYYSDIDVTAGADDLFTDGSHTASRFIYIPEFEDCDNAFPLYGDSMYPKYQSGQVILCKEFKEWRDFVPFGEVFLVITDSLRMVKYVKKASSDEHYLLASENSHFESFEVPKNRIRRMFLVKGAIQRNMI